MRRLRWVAVLVCGLLLSEAVVASALAEATTPPAELPDDTPSSTTDPAECGRTELGCHISAGFYQWLLGFIGDGLEFAVTLAAIPSLALPPPTGGVRTAWGDVLTITNSLYVLFVIAAGVLVMTYQTVQTSAAVKEILPRLVLGFVASNASFMIIETMRELGNAISMNMLDGAFTPEAITNALLRTLNSAGGEILLFLFLVLLGSQLLIFFIFAAIIRIVLWILLTIAAPLALACHALPQTDGLARLWWRAMITLLVIQIAQALVLRIMVTLFLDREVAPSFLELAQNTADVLLIICCLYVACRIPFWGFKQLFNIQGSPVVRVLKTVAALVVFRNVGRALSAVRGTAASRAASRAAPVPRRGPPPNTGGPPPRSGPSRPTPSPGGPGRGPRPGAGTGPGRNPRGGPGRGRGPGRGPRSPGTGPGRNPRGGPGRGTGPGPGPTPPPRPGPAPRRGPPRRPGPGRSPGPSSPRPRRPRRR